MYYPSSENKGADQLRGYREADLRLCFRISRLLVFPRGGSFSYPILYSMKVTSLKCDKSVRIMARHGLNSAWISSYLRPLKCLLLVSKSIQNCRVYKQILTNLQTYVIYMFMVIIIAGQIKITSITPISACCSHSCILG